MGFLFVRAYYIYTSQLAYYLCRRVILPIFFSFYLYFQHLHFIDKYVTEYIVARAREQRGNIWHTHTENEIYNGVYVLEVARDRERERRRVTR